MRWLRTWRRQLARDDLPAADKATLFLERALARTGLDRALVVAHHLVYELGDAPRVPRGLRDLVVREAGPEDSAALAAVAGAPVELIRARLRRGDVAYVGALDGRVLCHAFFHRGPEPFREDEARVIPIALASDTWWSYDAAAVPEAQASGVFVKVWTTALRELFARGAARVQSRVQRTNTRSKLMHDRLGFELLGTLLVLVTPFGRVLRWEGGATTVTRVLGWRPDPVAFPLVRP
jgi:hypothetical protein